MFDKVKRCKLTQIIKRLYRFTCVFSLRQGTILIAIHQITLCSFALITLLVGISHVGEMMALLHTDMEDEAERHGFYEVRRRGGGRLFLEGDVISTNNQRRFVTAQDLATITVMTLYICTVIMFLYLLCCISLLYGAVKYKRGFMMPWLGVTSVGLVLSVAMLIVMDSDPYMIQAIDMICGHTLYYIAFGSFICTSVYAITTVWSYAMEVGQCRQAATDERGERLLLLDHAAHSSLLSAKQLSKLSHSNTSHFV